MIQNITDLTRKLGSGALKSIDLVAEALERIADPAGQGGSAFLSVYAEAAMTQARWIDAARADGVPLPAFAGVPVAIKDLFDVAGEVTRAGSRASAPLSSQRRRPATQPMP